jgi:hypothetical protein
VSTGARQKKGNGVLTIRARERKRAWNCKEVEDSWQNTKMKEKKIGPE